MVITNPPWGHRLAGPAAHLPELESAWTDLGLFLKVRAQSGSAAEQPCERLCPVTCGYNVLNWLALLYGHQ